MITLFPPFVLSVWELLYKMLLDLNHKLAPHVVVDLDFGWLHGLCYAWNIPLTYAFCSLSKPKKKKKWLLFASAMPSQKKYFFFCFQYELTKKKVPFHFIDYQTEVSTSASGLFLNVDFNFYWYLRITSKRTFFLCSIYSIANVGACIIFE